IAVFLLQPGAQVFSLGDSTVRSSGYYAVAQGFGFLSRGRWLQQSARSSPRSKKPLLAPPTENCLGQGLARDFDRAKIWIRDEGEFDAVAHGVDAFGADADFITEMPFELAGLCAAARGRSACFGVANETR